MMGAANAAVPKITADEARKLIADENAVVVDVRDAPEVLASGKIKGAINISRGMLEFRADAEHRITMPNFKRIGRSFSIVLPAAARH